ncbi:8982_t:CDS:2 [Funneliformis geosporum]|uniref:8982_t:CDS:1 n=1 Tax=Funneliformis geosporum TaxID=1117311 RepID=A0A9W4T4V6_9GLOM|nr:8982_t:CDS:2 [Funneliformis geosporum]
MVCEVGVSIASDDLNPTYYYLKVACEKRLPLSSWTTLISVNNYNPTSENDYNNPLLFSALLQDPTLVLTWDIETYSSLGLGNFFTAQNVKIASDSHWTTIICGNQVNLLKAFALYWKCLALDIQIGFNDSQYDWRFIGLKETNATTAEQMREVAEYCIIDAISCQRLMIKYKAINKYREVVFVIFISLYDSYYFAIRMKVRNLLSFSAWQEGILTSIIPCEQTETGKYSRAYIFLLVKGLENRRPVTSLDFALL